MSPQFSIVTPCFNAMPFLPRCVGSIRGQREATCEHIVQDGGSKDGTIDWAAAQPGIAFVSEKDRGMYDAINKGWSRSRGDFLSWLNADEQYLPGALARVARAFAENPQADVVWGDTIIVDPDGRALAARREIPLRACYVKNGFLYSLSCSVFFHRRLFDGGLLKFDLAFRVAGDADLMLRLLAARRRFVHMREYIGLFGVDGGNLSVAQGARMEEEMKVVRERHGAFRNAAARRIVMLARHIERLASGLYAPGTLSYDFALDGTPAYRRYENIHAPARFTYDSALKKMQAEKT